MSLILYCLRFIQVLLGLSLIFPAYSSLIPRIAYADVWSVSLQNDVVFSTDERYTNGISYDWMSNIIPNSDPGDSEGRYFSFVYSVMNSLNMIDVEANSISAGFRLAQDIYTPSDTSEEELIEDDIPYAGHLYTQYSIFEWEEKEAKETFFKIGLVGPSSGAEVSQKSFHRLIGNDEPKGWHNQLKDRLTVGLGFTHSYNMWQRTYNNGSSSGWFPSFGLEIGNFMSGFFSGILFRYGVNYPDQILPAYAATNAGLNSRLTFSSTAKSPGWSLNLGLFVNAIAYSLILDSSSEHDIERNSFIGTRVAGVTIYLNKVEITFSVQAVNTNVNNSGFYNSWGGISFSMTV